MKKIFILLIFCSSLNAQFIVNDAFKKATLLIENRTINGDIGTAFETVDHFSSFSINQTSANKILTLPDPNDLTDGDDVTVRNIGTNYFTMYGIKVYPDSFDLHLTWKDLRWRIVGIATSTNITSGGDCLACCDSLFYWPNDTAALNQGWVDSSEYYLLSNDNSYGLAWGILKQQKVDSSFNWVITEKQDNSAFDDYVQGTNTRVNFKGKGFAECKLKFPKQFLYYFKEDDDAKSTGGLIAGEYYMLTIDNSYGLPKGFIKKITE